MVFVLFYHCSGQMKDGKGSKSVIFKKKGTFSKFTQNWCNVCANHPHIITWGKRTFYTLRLRPPKKINLIMFRDSSVTFSAKISKKLRVHV